MIEVGSKVMLNGKYKDKRAFRGKVMTVTRIGDICGEKCAWVDDPGFGCGGYALDGFNDVEDSDDFQGQNKHWKREEEYEMLCPSCDEYMMVRVAWEPTYTWAAKVVAP